MGATNAPITAKYLNREYQIEQMAFSKADDQTKVNINK